MPPITIDLTKATAAAKPSLSTCADCSYPIFVRCGIAILIIIFMLHILSVCDKGRSLVRRRSRGRSLNEGIVGRHYGSTGCFSQDNPHLHGTSSYFSVFEKGIGNTSG
ncbi:hypothetical protein BDZ89DRAFT_1075766 [Hymenopellis radicata]|nr:hypothetical protein BDZ89DRAFT_1075766 [Hymenopellis radicata]